jgi:hypothetical protein
MLEFEEEEEEKKKVSLISHINSSETYLNFCRPALGGNIYAFCCSTVHFDNIKVFLTNKCTIY